MADTTPAVVHVDLPSGDTVAVKQTSKFLANWKTLAFNAAVVAGVAVATWASGQDWTQYVSPSAAVIIVGIANIVLRVLTNGPAFSNVTVKKI